MIYTIVREKKQHEREIAEPKKKLKRKKDREREEKDLKHE